MKVIQILQPLDKLLNKNLIEKTKELAYKKIDTPIRNEWEQRYHNTIIYTNAFLDALAALGYTVTITKNDEKYVIKREE